MLCSITKLIRLWVKKKKKKGKRSTLVCFSMKPWRTGLEPLATRSALMVWVSRNVTHLKKTTKKTAWHMQNVSAFFGVQVWTVKGKPTIETITERCLSNTSSHQVSFRASYSWFFFVTQRTSSRPGNVYQSGTISLLRQNEQTCHLRGDERRHSD